MSIPNRPTLIYPNGKESILSRIVEISWIEPFPLSIDTYTAWYEIYYTEVYNDLEEPNWKQIGTAPKGISSFKWKVGSSVHSSRVRVAICSVNVLGERSEFSASADCFEIKKSQPLTPSVLSPIPGGRYGSSVEIVLDDSAIKNTFAQRAKYYIFFSSVKNGIPSAPIAQKIPVGTGPIIWDTSLLKPSDDYIITIYLADDDGNKSQEVNIENIIISNEGFFIIDTKPPSGFVLINRGDQFTRDPNVSVQLYSYDAETDIHSLRFKEGETLGGPESYTNLKYYKFKENEDGSVEDGIKTLEVLFQDFAGNRSSEILKSFRHYFEVNNEDISDMIYQRSNGVIWIAFNGNSPAIYKDNMGTSFVTRVNEPINALGLLNDTLYIAVKSSDGTALVYRLTGTEISEAISLSVADTEVISLESYKGNLYLGTKGGYLYSYDESSIDLIKEFDTSIEGLYSDGSLLYIMLKNSSKVVIYDGADTSEVES